jgi:hypothetical protein
MESEEDKALDWVNKLVSQKRGKKMDNNETALFRGAWNNLPYKEIHSKYKQFFKCSCDHLTKNISRDFFNLMKSVLNEKDVKKNNLKALVQAKLRQEQREEILQSEQDKRNTPLPNPTSSDLENPPEPDPPSNQGDDAGSEDCAFPETLSTNTQYIQDTIALIIKNPKALKIENRLKEIQVQPLKPESLRLFNLLEASFLGTTWCLEDLAKHLPQEEKNQRWLEDLAESVSSTLRGVLNPSRSRLKIQPVFRSSEGKLFRAILHSMTKSNDGSVEFTVIFEEHISRGYVENPPSLAYATLVTAINLGSRLRCELCDKYLPILDDSQRQGSEEIKRILREVKNSYEYINEEAELRRQGEAYNQSNADRLQNCFESEHEREKIKNNLLEQEEYKRTILKADTYDNFNKVRDALTKLNQLNEIVMHMVITRFDELF